jgi:F-type H+-transporting ATPase subunit delta
MSVYRISYRYANSLLLLSEEKKILSKIFEDAQIIYDALFSSKEFRAVLKNPVLKPKLKKELVKKVFEGKVGSDILSFIDFVIDKNREDILFDIFKEFLNLRDMREGVLRAHVKSAVELSDPMRQKIEQKLAGKTNKKVKADFGIDNSILGGFVVKIQDTVIDSSVKRQLELLRKKFSEEISFVQ